MSIKNSNNTIGNRIRDFPACRAVPQPTAPPRSSPTERHYFKSQINLIFLFVISSFPRKKCVCSYIALPTCSFPAYLYPLHDHSSVMFDVITMFVAATNATYTVTSQAPLPNCGYPQPTPPPHPLTDGCPFCVISHHCVQTYPSACGFMHNSVLLNTAKRQYSHLLRIQTTPFFFFCFCYVIVFPSNLLTRSNRAAAKPINKRTLLFVSPAVS